MLKTILLSDVVRQTESAGNAHAIRFEPGVYERQHAQAAVLKFASGSLISQPTARALGAMSFGHYQIMGYNIYGKCGYTKSLAEYLTSPQDQLDTFHKFIAPHYRDDDFHVMSANRFDLDDFSRFYNGSVIYAEALLKSFDYLERQ